MSCRKRTGSVVAAQARFLSSDIRLSANTQAYKRITSSGSEIVFDFCPDCGSTVRYRHEALEQQTIIPLGVIDEVELWQPTAAIYDDRRPAWLPHNEHIEWLD